MKFKVKLTTDEINIISCALNNDALVYLECAEENVDNKDFFYEDIESYRERISLKKKMDDVLKEDYE